MAHYICKGGCGSTLDEIGVCEMDGCANQWELMAECDCTDGLHGAQSDDEKEKEVITKDSNGNVLADGDEVALIKDLPLRGSSKTFKRGTKAKIKLTGNPEEVDCKLEGMAIVLRTEFLKKL